jgi:hypothetical protein
MHPSVGKERRDVRPVRGRHAAQKLPRKLSPVAGQDMARETQGARDPRRLFVILGCSQFRE